MATITSKVMTAGWLAGAGSSWVGETLPVLGTDNAVIAAGAIITMDGVCECGNDPGAGVDGLTIYGTLIPSTTVDSSLKVRGCVTNKSGGVFHNGTVLNAVYGVRKHSFEIDCVDVAGKYYFHNENGGTFKPYSALPSPWYSRLAADVAAAQNVVTVTDEVQGIWKVGGLIVVPACKTDYAVYSEAESYKSEIREIAGFNSATEIVVTANFSYDHQKVIVSNADVTWKEDCPVVYLDRDITIKSTDPDYPAHVINSSSVSNYTKWYPKGVEFKELGKSATELALTYRADPALAVAYSNPAFGNMSGISFHPGLNKKGFPGCLYALYNATLGPDISFDDMAVVGSAIQGAAGSNTYVFGEVYNINCRLSIGGTFFIFGSSSPLACNFGGSPLSGEGFITIENLECGGSIYGPNLAKVGEASFINIWVCAYIGLYQTSLDFNATDAVALAGYYSVYGSALTIKNLITNLYTKSTTGSDLGYIPDMEVVNWISEGVSPFNIHTGLIEIRIHDFGLVEDDDTRVTQRGYVKSCKSTFASPRDNVRTATNGAILLEPISATLALEFEHEISVENGKSVVATGYMYKDAAYNGADEPSVTLSGAGMTTSTMAYDEMTDAGGGFYQWTVSGTAARTTQAFLTVSCIGTAGHIVVADVIPLGADINTGDYLHYSHGSPAKTLAAAKLSAPDIATAVWEKVITTVTTSGSAGKIMNKILTLLKYIGFR